MGKKILALAAACVALAGCGQHAASGNSSTAANTVAAKPAVDRAAEEKALRDADVAWSAAAGRKDVDATVAFMADDGVTMSPNAPPAKGKDAIRKEWEGLTGFKDETISWEPTTVEVADSGELGYTAGTWKMAWTDDKQGNLEDHGKYLEVWKKVSGKWLCTHDMYSSDQTAPSRAK